VCDFAVAPRGQTLFAITADKSCLLSYQGTLKLTLWRTDNAWNTWVQVARLPTSNVYGLLAVDSGDPTQPLLYGFMPRTVKVTPDKAGFPHGTLSDNASDIFVSANGGKSWVAAPRQGVAAGLSPYRAPLGILSDGTIIASFIPRGFNNDNGDLNGSILYGWKQGQLSWHQVGPLLNNRTAAQQHTHHADDSAAKQRPRHAVGHGREFQRPAMVKSGRVYGGALPIALKISP
jgi:hypothetical protein